MKLSATDRELLKIPKDAQDWLVACMDPYHDNQLRLEGLPDMVSAPSVVKMHNQSVTLTAPVSAVADWDAIVAFTGCNSEIGLLPALVTSGASVDNTIAYNHALLSTGCPFGSFVVKAGASGSALDFGAPMTANDTHLALGACAIAPNSDRCRIIAVAFEVTNTTAEVYKQGSVTVAMLPSAVNDYGIVMAADSNGVPNRDVTFQSWYSPKFAATRAALIAIPGAQTWPAKDGVYAIPRMCTHTMPVESPAFNKRAAVVQDSESDTLYHITTPSAFDTYSNCTFNGVASSGFAALQAFFTGLSHETSLTITMRTIVEYFPSFNSALLPLTTPSPPFCPKAFEVYSRTAQIAPYAVPVKQNGAGEYFRKILRIIHGVSGIVAPFMGSYSPIVTGIGAVSGAAEDYLRKKKAARAVVKGRASAYAPKVARDEAGARAAPFRR